MGGKLPENGAVTSRPTSSHVRIRSTDLLARYTAFRKTENCEFKTSGQAFGQKMVTLVTNGFVGGVAVKRE